MTLPHFHIFRQVGVYSTDVYPAGVCPTDVYPAGVCPADVYPAGVYPENRALELILEKDTITHMVTLRMKARERFVLVDQNARADTFELLEAPSRNLGQVRVRFCERRQYSRAATVSLVQGISKAERMDQTIRQVTELGVAFIIPMQSARSTVLLTPETSLGKQERWQRLAHAAASQAACAFVPEVAAPAKLSDILPLVSQNDVLLVAWEEYTGGGIHEALAGVGKNAHVCVFVGPEGGFDEEEVKTLCAAGAKPVSLGGTILRTETAAVIACALVLHELGELGNRTGGVYDDEPLCNDGLRI